MSNLQKIYEEASQYFIGGASAGGRYNTTLKQPLYLKSANGSRIVDVDGKEYIDYHTGSGAAWRRRWRWELS